MAGTILTQPEGDDMLMLSLPCTVDRFIGRILKRTVAAALAIYSVRETVDKRRHLLFQAAAPKKLSTAAFVIERERVSGQSISPMQPHHLSQYPAQSANCTPRQFDGTILSLIKTRAVPHCFAAVRLRFAALPVPHIDFTRFYVCNIQCLRWEGL